MEIVTLGIDPAKNIFALHGVGSDGKAVLQRPAVKRAKLLELTAGLPPCRSDMEDFRKAMAAHKGSLAGDQVGFAKPIKSGQGNAGACGDSGA